MGGSSGYKEGSELPLASISNAAILRTRKSKLPDAFQTGRAKLPNNPLVAAGLKAIYSGGTRARNLTGGWHQNEGGGVNFVHRGHKGGQIRVYPCLEPSTDIEPSMATTALWEFVERLNPLTADVALALLAQMCEPSVGDQPKYPLCQPVIVTADSILRYKGFSRRGEEKKILLAGIHDAIRRLRQLRFSVDSFYALNPVSHRYQKVSWSDDVLLDIVEIETISQTLDGVETQVEVAWSVRAGHWAYWWLSPEARVYVGIMAKVLLELGHSGVAAMAKKIGQRCLLLSHAVRSGVLDLRIGTLLSEIGELPVAEARSPHWAGKTREFFDDAMTRLNAKVSGAEGETIFESVEWPDGDGPDDADRVRGWPERWLSAHIVITMAGFAGPALSVRNGGNSPRISRPRAKSLGSAIRAARLKHHPFWSQKELASHLGISDFTLSHIETNKKTPDEELERRIVDWMQSHLVAQEV